MNRRLLLPVCLFVSLVSSLFATFTSAAGSEPQGMQIDARGPVHEAYAQPWQANPSPNTLVDKKPPDPIPEEPAAEKPAGKNLQWIPGYWQWDQDRKDFVWVSGFWRQVPEGRRWIMGYWASVQEGWRWVSGHWAAAQEKDNQYIPEPPANPDQGPATTPPDSDSFYIPGSWFYNSSGYSYRAGYWAGYRAGYLWVPARYIWTSYGWVFASGYWDYGFGARGMLFAPVYFTRPLWLAPGWFYRPSFAIAFDGLYDSLFVGLGWSHYYFGDYYGSAYLSFGLYPWFWHSAHHYDPIWAHERWMHRNNAQWATGLHSTYVNRVNGMMAVPPRTFNAQIGTLPRTVNSFAQLHQSGQKLETVSAQIHSTQLQTAKQMVHQSQQLSLAAPKTFSGVPSSVHHLPTTAVPHMTFSPATGHTFAPTIHPAFPGGVHGGFPYGGRPASSGPIHR